MSVTVIRPAAAATPIGLIGANIAFRRQVFDRVGRFSPSVQRVKNGIGSTEDHELLTRLYAAGGRMLDHPRMLGLVRSMLSADWDGAFLAELRLRFVKGFIWTRVAH
ncbi:MAG TPA: hypothetical protein VEL51_03005 [Vicinamibacterales bacterium]|nr:hypothetical protein [Vicinamibacterales bacterium]